MPELEPPVASAGAAVEGRLARIAPRIVRVEALNPPTAL